MFDGDLLWPFSALPPRFHLHAYVTVSEERRLVWPNDWESVPGVVLANPKASFRLIYFLFLFFFFLCFEMLLDAGGRTGKAKAGNSGVGGLL